MSTPEDLYLELLKGVLTRTTFGEPFEPVALPSGGSWWWSLRSKLWRPIESLLARRHLVVARRVEFRPEERLIGGVWPGAETQIGISGLDNLQYCIETALADDVPGDFMETGVWRGGAAIFMRGVLAARGVGDRVIWAADSFEGLPKPDEQTYPADAGDLHWVRDDLAVSLDEVKANFERYGLLDDRVRFLKGWFKDTLPTAPIGRLAVLRLDGDMYESTMLALEHLYPKLSPGGFLIVDDWHVERARAAVEDYRKRESIDDEVVPVDRYRAYWRKK